MQGESVMTQQLWSACSSYHKTGNVQYVQCLQINAHVFTYPKHILVINRCNKTMVACQLSLLRACSHHVCICGDHRSQLEDCTPSVPFLLNLSHLLPLCLLPRLAASWAVNQNLTLRGVPPLACPTTLFHSHVSPDA